VSPSLHESWHEYRKRMLAETSRFIEWGLKHPDLVFRIPAKPAEHGGFPRAVADWFWETVLVLDGGSRLKRWREKLTLVRYILPGRG
jgi:hypothetical protein